MTRKAENRAAARALAASLAELPECEHLARFLLAGGVLGFSGNTNIARYRGLTASCTESSPAALRAWIRKALS